METQNRRQYPRFEGEFQVDLLNLGDDPGISAWEAVVTATALDISRHGLRLKTAYNVPLGAVLSAIVYYEHAESVCLCEVVWKKEIAGEFVYGLFIKEWSKMSRHLEDRLASLDTIGAIRSLTPPLTPA